MDDPSKVSIICMVTIHPLNIEFCNSLPSPPVPPAPAISNLLPPWWCTTTLSDDDLFFDFVSAGFSYSCRGWHPRPNIPHSNNLPDSICFFVGGHNTCDTSRWSFELVFTWLRFTLGIELAILFHFTIGTSIPNNSTCCFSFRVVPKTLMMICY